MAQISTIVWDNGAGLSRDADLVESLLTDRGHRVVRHHLAPPGMIERVRHRIARAPRYDLNLFIQNVVVEWLPLARRNALLPNPEHMPARECDLLPRLDAVLCKTRAAVELIAKFQGQPRFVGFTSFDRGGDDAGNQPASSRELGVLHVAGRSAQKGTAAVLAIWLEHPDWPPLTIVARPASGVLRPVVLPPNVRFIDHELDDAALVELQRTHPIHLCPSEAEGFGHTLAEAMSCGAIVITTDAPPMNELVTPEVGLLAAWSASAPMGATRRYAVDVEDLAQTVVKALKLAPLERAAMGSGARRRFVELDRGFRAGFAGVVAEVLEQNPIRQDG